MTTCRERFIRIISALLAGGLGITLLAAVPETNATIRGVVYARAEQEPTNQAVHLPLVLRDCGSGSSDWLCRFGVGAGSDIASYDVNSLRIGWYVDWTATLSPARPGGITYMPMLRLRQTGPDSYAYSPVGSVLSNTIAANPGATWLIGNEPDRRYWQDSLEPHVYARAYHDLYHLIKDLDSEARIAAGGIVQPTPLRLQYLDMVLAAYQSLYGEPMPVDVWNIHAFILRERSCDYFPDDCWGAEIPPGIDAPEGMLYDIQDNDSLDIFKEHVRRFRQWMADRGYQNCPLIISEFGVQMWPEYGFPPERVNAYMNATFDYLTSARDALGYPADDHRMVQRWAWYSLTDDDFNGWLFDADTGQRTEFGDNFAAYTERVEPSVNLAPVRMWTEPPLLLSSGEPVSLTLYIEISNSGNTRLITPTIARVYEKAPDGVEKPIGADLLVSSPLDGCGTSAVLTVTWHDVSPGWHPVFVVVDPLNDVSESNEADNVYSSGILIGTSGVWLPLVVR